MQQTLINNTEGRSGISKDCAEKKKKRIKIVHMVKTLVPEAANSVLHW